MKIAILSAVCASAGALLLPAGVHGSARSVFSPPLPRAAVVASISPGRAAGNAAAAVAASLAVLLSTEARADVGLELLSPITQFKLADGTNVGDKAEALKGLLKVPERDPEADAAAQKKREEAAKVRSPGGAVTRALHSHPAFEVQSAIHADSSSARCPVPTCPRVAGA